MNAFGHAVAASWERRDGAFLFGAMLPDLATLVGARVGTVDDAAVFAGLHHHVRADLAFHALPGFRDWWSEATAELRGLGLRRHSARAASHVAIELLLDGVLAREDAHARTHEAALSAALASEEPSWRRAPTADWRALLERLRAAGPPHALREPASVARRVEGSLGRRPRLALREEEVGALELWTRRASPGSVDRSRALARELAAALEPGTARTPGESRRTEGPRGGAPSSP